MKKHALAIGLLLLLLLLASCMGKDGRDGRIYLNIRTYNCSRYWDNNSAIPFGFDQTAFYRCNPGVFQFEYETYSEWIWEGTYTLISEPGTPGQFLKDGEDGWDRFYSLVCRESGPSLTYSYGRSGDSKAVTPVFQSDDEVEILHQHRGFGFHIKAKKIPAAHSSQRSKTERLF